MKHANSNYDELCVCVLVCLFHFSDDETALHKFYLSKIIPFMQETLKL